MNAKTVMTICLILLPILFFGSLGLLVWQATEGAWFKVLHNAINALAAGALFVVFRRLRSQE